MGSEIKSFRMPEAIEEIRNILIARSDNLARAAHQKFVPGVEKVYGVRTPVLNELARQFKQYGFPLVGQLWQAGSFEEKLLAVKLLGKIARSDPEQALQFIRQFAGNIGNWAVCDAMGMQGLKPILRSHQKEIFAMAEKYNRSADFWQRRLSLVLVEWYTRVPALRPAIARLAKNLEHDQEYYVRKAVAWIRRNLEKGK